MRGGGCSLSEGGGRAVFKMNAICLCDSANELSSAAFDLFCIADIITGRRPICYFITTFPAGYVGCTLQLYQSDSVLSCEVTPCWA